ncbi:receptor-like protein 15 [Tripterygium wilfordii]|uniref:receptor-like protein 15 n=1 Tax=Tripterygium wilfordii TaxID=458696 RepID=UPI0018F7E6CA|nr:receptor-like protein 15 [Tripterygium wilfordii]
MEHWIAVKHILKYLRRTRDYVLVYKSDELIPTGYTDSDFQSDKDSRKSTLGYVFTLGVACFQQVFPKNNFSGAIPEQFVSSQSSLSFVKLSNNKFFGHVHRTSFNSSVLRIPRWISKLSDLNDIDLSDNHLEGPIPQELCKQNNLHVLDLSQNNSSGNIPPCFIQVTNIESRDNDFSGTIPNWVGNHSNLGALLLKENHFHGSLTFENQNGFLDATPLFSRNEIGALVEVIELVTKNISLDHRSSILNLMSRIDLSSNQFCGDIPHQFGNLSRVRALNLSHNNLIGPIPETFSNLKSIESLDLSYNYLNDRIPPQRTELNTIEVFTLVHNNLSRPVLDRKAQFATFDESNYEGNPCLCGPPLNNSCDEIDSALPITNEFPSERDNDSFMDMFVFNVSFTTSYIVVLLGIATILCINPYWQLVWFYKIELWITRCYYFFLDKFT